MGRFVRSTYLTNKETEKIIVRSTYLAGLLRPNHFLAFKGYQGPRNDGQKTQSQHINGTTYQRSNI